MTSTSSRVLLLLLVLLLLVLVLALVAAVAVALTLVRTPPEAIYVIMASPWWIVSTKENKPPRLVDKLVSETARAILTSAMSNTISLCVSAK